MIGSIIGGLASATNDLGFGLANTILSAQTTRKNYQLQKDVFAWQKKMQKEHWSREDSAVQRRVQDLMSAGLSPTLAAGQAAQAHAPIPVTAPQKEMVDFSKMNMLDKLTSVMQVISMKNDIARTKADTDLVREKVTSEIVDRQLREKAMGLRETEVEQNIIRTANDTERVRQAAHQLGIQEQQLQNDLRRIANDTQRINLEAQRVLNDSTRVAIEKDHRDILNLLHQAQTNQVNDRVLTQQLERRGISIDQAHQIQKYQGLVYDYLLSRVFGFRTTDTLGGDALRMILGTVGHSGGFTSDAFNMADLAVRQLLRRLDE